LPGGSSLRVFARIVHRSINQEKFPEHSTIGPDAGKFPALMKIFGKNLRKKTGRKKLENFSRPITQSSVLT
jgi:hypothetical protein